MSETNWTPGPWKVDEEARVGDYGIEATPSAYTHVTVAVSIQSEGCAYPISSAEARNNARLIAAAPELYQALDSSIIRQLIGEIEDNPSMATAGLWALAVQWMELRDAALAKARGEA